MPHQPVLAAAGIDYDLVNGNRYGTLTSSIAEKIKTRRRIALGLEAEATPAIPLPRQLSPEQRRAKELQGGIVIIGRHTFKEFMEGQRRGWTESLERLDEDAGLSLELQANNVFDEPPLVVDERSEVFTQSPPLQIPSSSTLPKLPVMSPSSTSPPPHSTTSASIPPMPALLLVSYRNIIGFRNVPWMLIDFFNERQKVGTGCEAAYRLVKSCTSEFAAPSPSEANASSIASSSGDSSSGVNDLNFNLDLEKWYPSSFLKLPDSIEKARKEYYTALPQKIKVARELSRGTRSPTKDEKSHPPPTEVELHAERLKKEKRWRDDLAGWQILKPDTPVAWDERFRGVLQVFKDPGEGKSST